jgi:hypothetical protein
MKTTVEISDSLFERARKLAAARGEPFRALLEEALRRLLEAESAASRPKPFRMRDGSFGGRGLQKGLAEGDWQAIRERAYEGRGG